jgi:hypothetical protein
MGEPELAGALVAFGAAVPVELVVLGLELHAATIVIAPAVTVTAAILIGLACDCFSMRTWSPRETLETSPPTGEIAGGRGTCLNRRNLPKPTVGAGLFGIDTSQ